MNNKTVYVRTGNSVRIVGQPVQDGEIEIFVHRELTRGIQLREETPYIWADFFRVPVQEVMNIIKKVQEEATHE